MKLLQVILAVVLIFTLTVGAHAQEIEIQAVSQGTTQTVELFTPTVVDTAYTPTNNSGGVVSAATSLGTYEIELRPWVNLTYKGGMDAYNKILAQQIPIWGEGFIVANPQGVDGYIVGVPYIPKTPAPQPTPVADPPAVEPPKQEEPKQEPKQEEPKPETPAAPSLTQADATAINKTISDAMRFAVSTREEAKVAQQVYTSQSTRISDFIKNRNEAVLKLDDSSTEKQVVEAVRKLMPNLIKADKLKVVSVTPLAADEVKASITIPVFSQYNDLPADIKSKMDKNLDYTKQGSWGLLLGNPATAMSKMDATVFESDAAFMAEFLKVAGNIDLYTQYPSAFSTGAMEVTLKKEGTSWKLDADSLTILAEMGGKAESIILLK